MVADTRCVRRRPAMSWAVGYAEYQQQEQQDEHRQQDVVNVLHGLRSLDGPVWEL